MLELPPENEPNDEGTQSHNHGGSQNVVPQGVLIKDGRHAQQRQGQEEEHEGNVENGKHAPITRGASQPPGGVHGDAAQVGNRIPDENPRNVEKEMGQSDLEGFDLVRNERRQQCRHGGANVASQGQGKHLFQLNDSHSNERC